MNASSARSASKPRILRRRQRGQALTEMAILAVIVIPLILLIPVLGKYIHARQVAQQAVRAAAWEATVSAGYDIRTQMQVERQQALLVDRHFNDADAIVQTDLAPLDPEDDGRLGGAMFNTFSDQPLVEREDLVLEEYAHAPMPGALGGAAELVPSFFPGDFPPSDSAGNVNGLVTASLEMSFQNLRVSDGSAALFLSPFDAIDLQLSASHSLVADTWNARGSGISGSPSEGHHRNVYNQIRGLAPATNLSAIDDFVSRVPSFVQELVPLARLDFDIARKTLDIVPDDKLRAFEE